MALTTPITAPRTPVPLAAALGWHQYLEASIEQPIADPLLEQLSPVEQRLFFLEGTDLVIYCRPASAADRTVHPSSPQGPNVALLKVALRRVLALNYLHPAPVVLCVKNRMQGKQVLSLLKEVAPSVSVYSFIYGVRSKDPNRRGTQQAVQAVEAPLLLMTYHKLRELAHAQALPSVRRVVFVDPLSQAFCSTEAITLDTIRGALQRHKRQLSFTYVLAGERWPALPPAVVARLLQVPPSQQLQLVLPQTPKGSDAAMPAPDPSSSFPAAPIPLLRQLMDDHLLFFILTELSCRRQTAHGLWQKFQQTFSFQLFAYSRAIGYPRGEEPAPQAPIFGVRDCMRVVAGKRLTQQAPPVDEPSDPSPGELCYELFVRLQQLLQRLVRGVTLPPLVEQRANNWYYLSELGALLLTKTSNYAGLNVQFRSFLETMAVTVPQDSFLSLEQLLELYERFIAGSSPFSSKEKQARAASLQQIEVLVEQLALRLGKDEQASPMTTKEAFSERGTAGTPILPTLGENSEELLRQLDRQLTMLCGKKTYQSFALGQLLSVFRDRMSAKARFVFSRLHSLQRQQQQERWARIRTQAILRLANREVVSRSRVARKYHLTYSQAATLLDELVLLGELVKLVTTNCHGKTRIKYCSLDLFTAKEHLQHVCGECQFFDRHFKWCRFLRILRACNPSHLPMGYRRYAKQRLAEHSTACPLFVQEEQEEEQQEGQKEQTQQEGPSRQDNRSLGQGVRAGCQYTYTKEAFARQAKELPFDSVLGLEPMTATYHCLLCQRIIREFGEDELPHFPRQHIRCPHCATSYREKANGKIELRTERRDILRLAYWKLTGSVPKVLQEREPFFGFVIADVDDAFLWEEQTVLDSSEPSFWLSVRGQSVPLDHVHWVFFSGTEQQELEEQLHALAEQAPERFTYSLARTRQKLRTVLSEEDKHEASPSVSSFLTNISSPRSLISSPHSSQDRSSSSSQSPPSTDKQNSTDARLQQYQLVFHGLAQTGCLNNAFLRARQLSNFGAMLTLRQEDLVALEKNDRLPSPFLSEEQEHPSLGLPWRYDWQLLAMVNSLLRASAGVTSDYYALQLEGQNNKWFFELVKATGRTAGCESWGRVASRFVQDRFQSYGPGQAYSELDAFINYFTRLIRELLDPLFVAVGLEPEELGAGLFHHRRSRSDLEKLGAYFDLIDPVRALVLRALVYGIQKGLSFRDLVFVLGSGGREQYRVRWDALKKFELLLYWALGQPVVWQGKEQPFYRAYQAYLQSVKAFLDRCVERLAAFKCNFKECVVAARLSGLEVLDPKTWQGLPPEEQEELRRRLSALFRKVCREVSFQPFIFCPTGQRRRLTRVAQFAANWQQLFTGGEERVLERKRVRETFRAAAMQDWSTEEAPHTAALHRLTKYQRRERARTLTVALFLVYWVYRTGDWSRWYSTKFFQKALNLTQNRAYRLLKRMVQRGFLQTIRTPLTRVYRLAFTHPAVRELLQALDYERTKGLENGTTAVLASCSTASTDLAACHEPARPVDEPSEPSLQVVRLGMNLRTFPEKLAQAHQESYLVGATAEGSLAAILYRVKTEQLWEKWTVPAALQEALDWLKEFLGIDKEAP